MPRNIEPGIGQQALFEVVDVVSGETDPELVRRSVEFVDVSDAPVIPDAQTSQTTLNSDLAVKVHEAVVEDRRRRAQLGKHSPLVRDGTYLAVKPGDVIPDFGVVKWSNLSAARAHATARQRELDRPK